MFNLTELFNVKGLSVVITGGGTGLGLHMAKAFATNGAKGAPTIHEVEDS